MGWEEDDTTKILFGVNGLIRCCGACDRLGIRLLGHFDGTKQIREPLRRHDHVPPQTQGPGRPYRREIGVDGNVIPRLDVVDI
jgi:hypothetical protein